MRPLLAIFALLVLAACLPGQPLDAQTGEQRIVAVGDLHGDYEAWSDIAKAAGISKDGKRWSGGTTVLVQMGDITDRGPDSLKIIRDLQRLAKEAPRKGGRVEVLLGNHEAMNVIGDLRYVDPGEYAAFATRNSEQLRRRLWQAIAPERIASARVDDPEASEEGVRDRWFALTPLGLIEHRQAWSPGGELAQWAAARPAVLMIGETLFAHGGLSLETSVEPIDTINARHAAALSPGDAVDRSILESQLGPLWYRGNVVGAPEQGVRPVPEGEFEAVLANFGAKRLVVAHTPALKGISAERDSRLLRIDTGISRAYGGPASFLEIIDGMAFAVERGADGKWTRRALDAPGAGGDSQ